MDDPMKTRMIAVKKVLRYLMGMMDYGILLPTSKKKTLDAEIIFYWDVDLYGDKMNRGRTT